MSSTSVRKRADGFYEENFENPQFEQGRKSVPQAELEHVSPEPPQLKNPEQKSTTGVEFDNSRILKTKVSEHLQKISTCLNQINDLISEIQLEKENIKRVLQNLHL